LYKVLEAVLFWKPGFGTRLMPALGPCALADLHKICLQREKGAAMRYGHKTVLV